MHRRVRRGLVVPLALSILAVSPASAQTSDPFQSAPVTAPPKPAPAPRPAPRRRAPEPEPYREPTPAAIPAPAPIPTAPASFVGTWTGQVYQFPFTLVVLADNGQTLSVQWRGTRIVAGRAVDEAPVTLTGQRQGDGSFSVVNPGSDNRIDNAHWCGTNLCATFYLRSSDSRTSVVLRRTQ